MVTEAMEVWTVTIHHILFQMIAMVGVSPPYFMLKKAPPFLHLSCLFYMIESRKKLTISKTFKTR